MKRIDNQNTKIIATVGPASSSVENLIQLVEAGVDVFRLNFSHGTHEDHQEVIDRVIYVNERYNVHIGLLADLQGPKIRIGMVQDEPVQLIAEEIIEFTTTECIGTKEKVFINYSNFPKDVKAGEKVLLDDGKLEFEVIETNRKDLVKLKVLFGGPLSSKKGVNLPDSQLSIPCITKKDKEDLDFILTQPVNWIALSFVRKASDIFELKELIDAKNHPAKMIAKIEKPEAVKNINKIIKMSNGIMIARGDLGVEMPMEKLPNIQKIIINKCIQRARPVIVATQMMDSMITNPSPTRAEVTDVANAVLDGCDAVMLSGETSVGKHPVVVVEAMNRIISEAESYYSKHAQTKRPKPNIKSNTFLSDVVCLNSAKVAEDIKAKGIIGLTVSGYTAFKVSSYRPNTKIYIFSHDLNTLRTLNLVWGVHGYYYDKFTTTDGTIEDVVKILKRAKRVNVGDTVVNTGSMPIHKRFRTNMLKVTVVD
jgi:pyruvate kinase